jgi:hypothetical protein
MIHLINPNLRRALLGAVITFSTAGSAFATVLASDHFDYPAGTFSADAWNGGSGWSAPWTDVSGTATYDPAIGGDGRLHTESLSTADRHKGVLRSFSSTYNTSTSGTLWGNVSISISATGETTDYAWLSFTEGTTEKFRFGRIQGQTTGNTHWGLQGGAAGSSNSVVGTTINSLVTLGEAANLVYKIEYAGGNTLLSVWINPTAAAEGELGTADATFTQTGSVVFNGVRLQSRASATFDDFILGTSYADVIPEPSSAMLGVLGSSLLLIRKRRDA